MYTIILGLDGVYHCHFRLQDGTERYTYKTLEKAIKEAKRFAKFMNGNKNLKKKHITFLKEQPVTKYEYVEWKPNE